MPHSLAFLRHCFASGVGPGSCLTCVTTIASSGPYHVRCMQGITIMLMTRHDDRSVEDQGTCSRTARGNEGSPFAAQWSAVCTSHVNIAALAIWYHSSAGTTCGLVCHDATPEEECVWHSVECTACNRTNVRAACQGRAAGHGRA